jgi:hypothetical protein
MMARTCGVDNCFQPVFGTDKNTNIGYCWKHQYHRTDKKNARKELGIKKIKVTTVRDDLMTSFGFNDQIIMFNTLWENHKDEKGRVFCTFSGQQLNGFLISDLYYNCFAHLLSKKNYPWFKLNPANVAIVHPEFHRIVDQGTFKERSEHPTWDWEAWDLRVLKMKEDYAQFKRENLLA